MAFDENGNPIEEKLPQLVDKLKPIQALHRRRLNLKMNAVTEGPFDMPAINEAEERSMFIDALEYIEIYSEDVFARLMARESLGKRERK